MENQAEGDFTASLNHLTWCWQFLHTCDTELCHLHVEVASELAYALATQGEFSRLTEFVCSLSMDEYTIVYGHEKFVKARVLLNIHEGNYVDALCLLKNGRFEGNDKNLISLWDNVHYKLVETDKDRPLTHLDKFKIRKRHPPPPSICAEGQRPRHGLPYMATPVLRAWLHRHLDRPYPSSDAAQHLASCANMSVKQIKTWFANARRKIRQGRYMTRRGRPSGFTVKTSQTSQTLRQQHLATTGSDS